MKSHFVQLVTNFDKKSEVQKLKSLVGELTLELKKSDEEAI